VCGFNGERNMTEITLDCCNLQVDKKQTCAPVSQSGAAIPAWDIITVDQQGQCTSAGPSSLVWSRPTATVLVGLVGFLALAATAAAL
jgi:hypothetical protein